MLETLALFYAFFRRLAVRRWRLLLLVLLLCIIPVLIVQFVMLQEEQSGSYFDFWNRPDPNSRLAIQLLDDRPIVRGGNSASKNAEEPFWQKFRNVTFPPELSRSLQYCNRLVPKGEEGSHQSNEQWQMSSLFVIIRHGARTPLRVSPHYSHQLNCSVDVLAQYNDDELNEFMIRLTHLNQINSHKEFQNMSPYPDKKRCPQASLTGIGVLQNFVLGSLLSQAYHHFLSELRRDHFQSFITQTERTFQSHNAFFTALLMRLIKRSSASEIWNKVVQPVDSFAFCSTKYVTDCKCPKLRLYFGDMMAYRQTYLKQDPRCSAVHSSLIKFFENVHLSDDINDQPGIMNLWELRDIVMSGLCSQIDLLKEARICWKSAAKDQSDTDLCLSKDMLHGIWLALDPLHENLIKKESHRKYSKLTMYPFLVQLVERMKQPHPIFKEYNQEESHDSSENSKNYDSDVNNEPRFLLYSGHDHTLHYLLAALSLNISEWPPFSSRLVFEVFTHTSIPKRKRFRLLYNGRDISHRLSFCSSINDSAPGCEVDQLDKYLNTDYWSGFQTNNFFGECH